MAASDPAHRRTIAPVTVTRWDPDVRAHVRRTFGYRARCACGWKGVVARSIMEARVDHASHVAAVERGES